MQTVTGAAMRTKHPDARYINIFADCPHCHREEWFTLLVNQHANVVHCQFEGSPLNPSMAYIVVYGLPSPDGTPAAI